MFGSHVRAAILAGVFTFSLSGQPDSGMAPVSATPGPLAQPVGQGPTPALTVLSLNLAMSEDADALAAGIRAVGGDAADVLLFQEAVEAPGQPSVAARVAAALGPSFNTVYRAGFAIDGGRSVGLAAVSRFPVLDARVLALKRFNLGFRSRERTALAVTLATPAGALRVYNVHLDTRINAGDRLEQVAGVIQDLDDLPSIVAGDFNTNNNLWLFHTIPLPFLGRQGQGLERYMERHGLLSAFTDEPTHDTLRMRLDWMFLKGLQTAASTIHPTDVSDHHALVARLSTSR